MKKFILCKICLVVFIALFAAESVLAVNWNKNSDSEKVDDQYAQIDKAGKGIQWRLRPTSLISRQEQIIFVPDPLGSDDQVIQFERLAMVIVAKTSNLTDRSGVIVTEEKIELK